MECQIDKPLISIVIPTYNHAQFLGLALRSVVDQTYTNWEAIVIDNHSSDNTDEIVQGFNDPRITLLKIHNKGIIASSRNMGIREAKGKWIAFLDSDDIWYPMKLERCMQKIESGYDLVCHGELWVSEQNGLQRVREVFYGPEARASFHSLLFEGNCISTSAVVVRRQCLIMVDCFNECKDLITAEDYHLWLKLARAGSLFSFLPEILGEYTIHAGNSSKAALHHMETVRSAFKKMYSEVEVPSLKMRIQAWRRLAIIDYSGGRGLQSNREFRKALFWFLKAIVRWPFLPKFYVALLLNALCRQPEDEISKWIKLSMIYQRLFSS